VTSSILSRSIREASFSLLSPSRAGRTLPRGSDTNDAPVITAVQAGSCNPEGTRTPVRGQASPRAPSSGNVASGS
jgi:hypothetical protein